eukprot:TRINITY_DN1805_c0_g2_i2.p1 TRINITY_DN1805_c0_g2~~TRINITY_DN1805_c0_g2_i2.p1  ORF type:complete len:448 (+),score=86.83 TRINITY_DN1805_c0_g2_i2:45-1346(+)
MREVVSIQVGQGGNQIGAKFWEAISKEHGLDSSGEYKGNTTEQTEKIRVYYNEEPTGRYVPRTVLLDLDPSPLDCLRYDSHTQYRKENFLSSTTGTGSNWAKGHYSEGADMLDPTMDTIRKEIERCEGLQGFQLSHTLGGGTGSGMGTLLLSHLREEYPDKMMLTFSTVPRRTRSFVAEPYNTVLSVHQLIENADACVMLDNEALYDICYRTLKLQTPTFADVNRLVTEVTTGVTSTFRFRGMLNADIRRFVVNLVPYPRLHFLLTGIAPLAAGRALTVPELVVQSCDAKNMVCAADPRHGRYLTCFNNFRGPVSRKEVSDQALNVCGRNSSYYVEWIPNNVKASVNDVCTPTPSACFVGNNTSIQEMFRGVHTQYASFFSRRVCLHWYTMEGMDEMEFAEAEENLTDLNREYQQYQDATCEEDYEFDDAELF